MWGHNDRSDDAIVGDWNHLHHCPPDTARASRTPDAVTIATDLGQRRSLVDTRTLERTYVDGDTIKMELVLTTARGDTVRITRYLVRSALPAPAPVAAAVAPPG